MRPFALILAALAWCALAVPFTDATDATDPNLAPWTTLGISADDAANFAASGVSPIEGAEIIAAEDALFNGTVAATCRRRLPLTSIAGTQVSNVPGAYSGATEMGLSMGDAATADGTNLKLVIVVGWRR